MSKRTINCEMFAEKWEEDNSVLLSSVVFKNNKDGTYSTLATMISVPIECFQKFVEFTERLTYQAQSSNCIKFSENWEIQVKLGPIPWQKILGGKNEDATSVENLQIWAYNPGAKDKRELIIVPPEEISEFHDFLKEIQTNINNKF